MTILDASAILAFLQDEPGAEAVEAALRTSAACSSANWSEVAQKTQRRGGRWPIARGVLLSYALVIEPVTQGDAEAAADLWVLHPTLSLADRLCLALAARLGETVLTTDGAWDGVTPLVRVLR